MKNIIEIERKKLLGEGKTRTQVARELYNKYYSFLFNFSEDLSKSNTSKIIIKKDAVYLVSKDEIIISIPKNEISVLGQWLIMPEYESFEQVIIIKILDYFSKSLNEFSFFDIGANIGWYSLFVDKKYSKCTIHSFEPSKATFELFSKNIMLNSSNKIKANNFGLSDEIGFKEFYFCEDMLGASSLADTIKDVKKEKIICSFNTLDNYCLSNNISPDFIKVDVEGAEFLVMKGGNKVLNNNKPVVMLELLRKWAKFFNYHPNDVIEYMENLGYKCFVANKDSLFPFDRVDDNTIETNYFFLHSDYHKDLIENLKP